MSLFDKVTKAVTSAVDKGKAEVDQFMRIQKINGEIGDLEKQIAGFKDQIQAATKQAGEKAMAMAKAGEIAVPELKTFADQIAGFEKDVAAQEAVIVEKRKAIEAIKAEDEAPKADDAVPSVPPVPEAAAQAAKFCGACGKPLTGAGVFCPHCGAKQA